MRVAFLGSMEPKEAIEVMEHLLELCADGVEGYRHAAEGMTDPALRRELHARSAEREEIVAVLTNALVELGHKPRHHGTVLGAAHRRWMDFLARAKHDPTLTLLDECARGEHDTIEAFVRAAGRPLPAPVLDVVRTQLGRVIRAGAALRETIEREEPAHSL